MTQASDARGDPPVHLSELLRHSLRDPRGEQVGRLGDVVARFRRDDYPEISGLVAEIGGRQVFVPIEQIEAFSADDLRLAQAQVDLRHFERRPGEFLLKADVLGHRLIDVHNARFERAYDVELTGHGHDFRVTALDTHRHGRFLGLLRTHSPEPPATDWKAFEPLVGSKPPAQLRGRLLRLRRLRPAQLADLLEQASAEEGEDILGAVGRDRELVADVFEEMDVAHQVRYLESRDDEAVVALLGRMQPNDVVDLILELDQERRQHVLDLLEEPLHGKVQQLLAYNPGTAGGLMSPDLLSVAPDSSVGAALERVRRASELSPEALACVCVVDEQRRLLATVSLVALVQADAEARIGEVADDDPPRVLASTDTVEVALLLADYNLTALPVTDGQETLLGIVTVDDILEEVLPEEWKRRERDMPRRPIGRPARHKQA